MCKNTLFNCLFSAEGDSLIPQLQKQANIRANKFRKEQTRIANVKLIVYYATKKRTLNSSGNIERHMKVNENHKCAQLLMNHMKTCLQGA